jgi:serine/threonine-protein kinase
MPVQICPNCETAHDVSIYVTGQRVLCTCGIRFEVNRGDVSGPGTVPGRPRRQDEPASNAGPAPATAPGELGDGTFVAKPSSVPGYELCELLGRGGMGEVWRAKQLSLGRFVAMKILAKNLSDDPEFVTRFDKEAAALAALSHPNIVQIIDRGASEGTYFFAMELVDGASLRDLMAGGRIPPAEALRIVAQICLAMDYAHERGVIHRDLKPENILLDKQGNVKVADFGLAGMAGAEPRFDVTRASTAMGTLHYMAPEQRRDARAVDGRADVYSLGVILYELLTGEVPLGRFKLPSARVTGVDHRVDSIIEKALEPEPGARYARASLVRRDIENLITTQPWTPASRASARGIDDLAEDAPRPEGWSFRRRQRRRNFGLAFALVGVVAGVIGTIAYWRFHRSDGASGPPAGVLPPDTHRDRPLHASISVKDKVTTVEAASFGEGPESMFAFHSGEWDYRDGLLFARVYDPGGAAKDRFMPNAYLQRPRFHGGNLEAEVVVTVDTNRPWAGSRDDSDAALLFRPRGGEIGLHAVLPLGPDKGPFYRVSWRYIDANGDKHEGDEKDTDEVDEEEVHPPAPNHSMHLKLQIGADNVVTAFADGIQFFVQKLPGSSRLEGRVALECRNAICRFARFTANGRASMNDPIAAPTPHRHDGRAGSEE